MEESNILIAIITLGVGGVIGYFAGRSSSSGNSVQEQKVDNLQSEINEYKDSVANHFKQTATMINEMNDSYKSVVQHLAKGSQDLCDAGTAKDIESRLIPKLEPEQEELEAKAQQGSQKTTTTEPPRDYAPKQPDEVGVLSENYGIPNPVENSPAKPNNTAQPLDTAPKA